MAKFSLKQEKLGRINNTQKFQKFPNFFVEKIKHWDRDFMHRSNMPGENIFVNMQSFQEIQELDELQ
jgi:hypothetical protein